MRYKKKLNNVMIAGILLIAVSGAVAACSPVVASQNEAVQPTSDEVRAANTDVPGTEVVQAGEVTPSGDTESPSASIPTARAGLEGTDPGTVNLASGEIQLIEAFAFW